MFPAVLLIEHRHQLAQAVEVAALRVIGEPRKSLLEHTDWPPFFEAAFELFGRQERRRIGHGSYRHGGILGRPVRANL